MIIVEQDKTYFVNYNNVICITVAVDEEEIEYAIVAETIKDSEIILGIYKTEERAKEVLQEITDAYRDYRTAECDGYTNILEATAVYEMPEE